MNFYNLLHIQVMKAKDLEMIYLLLKESKLENRL